MFSRRALYDKDQKVQLGSFREVDLASGHKEKGL